VQGLLSVQTFGVLKQPATGSQVAVLHRFGGLQTVAVVLQVLVAGSQTELRHLFVTWEEQIKDGFK
jgi:hypothetical protein